MNYSIAHVAFHAADMQKSLDFYCNKLGLSHSFSIQDNDGNPWIEYLKVTDNQFIELFYEKREQVLNSYAHLCLRVEDIHALAAELKSKGVSLDVEPMQGKDLNWQCWAKDPDGNPIEFMQIDSNSPQANAK
ncbi:VOC family protein [Paludicola sp. MB14-C6]|uniref:VOC family protein n=1 Tax=Paludihabitans sp. MB14-C6 TaxID=3070656 RepID=UPI0027DCA1AF|nr:VOC family protein [Paludicola sp. MB14-C6]WMJ24274.1 VOC family protein [Paludicola sp. MB14-C6]